jgi:hypothetical protein
MLMDRPEAASEPKPDEKKKKTEPKTEEKKTAKAA